MKYEEILTLFLLACGDKDDRFYFSSKADKFSFRKSAENHFEVLCMETSLNMGFLPHLDLVFIAIEVDSEGNDTTNEIFVTWNELPSEVQSNIIDEIIEEVIQRIRLKKA